MNEFAEKEIQDVCEVLHIKGGRRLIEKLNQLIEQLNQTEICPTVGKSDCDPDQVVFNLDQERYRLVYHSKKDDMLLKLVLTEHGPDVRALQETLITIAEDHYSHQPRSPDEMIEMAIAALNKHRIPE